MGRQKGKRILAAGLAFALALPFLHTQAYAKPQGPQGAAGAVEGRTGLMPFMEVDFSEFPDTGERWALEETQAHRGRGAESEAAEWESYSSKLYYNQFSVGQQQFWDDLEAMSFEYLLGEKNVEGVMSEGGLLLSERVPYQGITREEADQVIKKFLYSNPQFYFYAPGGGAYEDSQTSGYGSILIYDSFRDGKTRAGETERLKESIDACISKIDLKGTDLEKEKQAHDIICDMVDYDYDEGNVMENQTIYSTFLTGKTVCAGYAQAFELLCNAVGVESVAVTSRAHQWNLVRLEDTWYYADPTWDDEANGARNYNFFNRSLEFMLKSEESTQGENHVPLDHWMAYLPDCTHDSGAGGDYIGEIYMPTERVGEPVISVDGNGTVTIGCGEPDAEVFYSINGGRPSMAATKSLKYSKAFQVQDGASIQAIAVKDGLYDSEAVKVRWPSMAAYAGQPFVLYMDADGVEGMDALAAGGSAAKFERQSGKFVWTPGKGQAGDSFDLTFTKGGAAVKTVCVQVLDAVSDSGGRREFAVAGPSSMTLGEGYGATGSGSFAVLGKESVPAIALSGNTGGGKLTWNAAESHIEAAPGLPKGRYRMQLVAKDGAETASCEFVCIVKGRQEMENTLPEFTGLKDYMRAYVGQRLSFYVKAEDADLGDAVTLEAPDLDVFGEKADVSFHTETGLFSFVPGDGDLGRSYSVVFAAHDRTGQQVTHTVTIAVSSSTVKEEAYAVSGDAYLGAHASEADLPFGNAAFLWVSRDASGELGELENLGSNKLSLLTLDLSRLAGREDLYEKAELSLTYVGSPALSGEGQTEQILAAAVDGFEWKESGITWNGWDAWRREHAFSVAKDAVKKSEEFPAFLYSEEDFQSSDIKIDITEWVRDAVKAGSGELTVLLNSKGAGGFLVSKEGAYGSLTHGTLEMIPMVSLTPWLHFSGPESQTLVEGYEATETESFSVVGASGKATVSLSPSSDPHFRWDGAAGCIRIAPGLAAGKHEATLLVSDEGGKTASCQFTLHVRPDFKAALRELYASVQKLPQGSYADADLAYIEDVLDTAGNVLADPGATEADAETVKGMLRLALQLQTAQEAFLKRIGPFLVQDKDQGKYTDVSWKNYKEKRDAALRLQNAGASVIGREGDAAAQALETAYRALALRADNSILTDPKTKLLYRVTNAKKKTVAAVGSKKKNASSITIPKTVTLNKVKYSVTEIGDGAFSGFAKLRKAVIGEKVAKIGKKCFYQCKKLSTVTFKGAKVTSIQAGAFKGIDKQARVNLPKKMSKKQKNALKKRIKSAGIGKKAVIK